MTAPRDDADTKPPGPPRSRRIRERIRAERTKVDTNTVKTRAGVNISALIKKVRRNPLVLGGLTIGGGSGMWAAAKELLEVTGPTSWIFFGLGAALVIAYGATDWLASVAGHLETQGQAVEDIRDMVADGFDEGEERFERIENALADHVKNHPGPTAKAKPRGKSGGKLAAYHGEDDTAVVPPVIDVDEPPSLNPV